MNNEYGSDRPCIHFIIMQYFWFLDWLLANHQSTNMICGEEKEKKPSCFDSAFLLHQKFSCLFTYYALLFELFIYQRAT